MKHLTLMTILVALPSGVYALDNTSDSSVYIKGGLNVSILDDSKKDSEAFGYEAGIGYQFSNDIFIEGSYQNFDMIRDDDIDLDALSLKANWLMPLSEYASVYAGAGFSWVNSDLSPTAQIGLHYALTNNWTAEIGYQGIFDIKEVKDDLYAFNLAFLYRFPSGQTPKPIEDVTNIEKEPPVTEQPHDIHPQPAICYFDSTPYTLVEGDYLNKIARLNDITLAKLLELNPQLIGRDINLVYPGEKINYPTKKCDK
ncbi:outer membrane beta-barrel protein [Vibrio campbellii]